MVRVEPVRPEWAIALTEGDAEFCDRFGVPVEPGWLVFPEVRSALVAGAQCNDPDAWGLHLIFDDDGALVGNGGWKGRPVDGVAELGYAVAPSRRRRGVATAAVRELVSRARGEGVRTVLAHTLAEESASAAVLRHCGFVKVGELNDAEDGVVWRWELDVESTAGPRG